MSGTALKNSNTTRYTASEYHSVKDRIVQKVEDLFRGTVTGNIQVLPAYRNKPDFGSLSIFVEAEDLKADAALASKLAAWFASPETVVRDRSVVFAVDRLQVNLTVLSFEDYNLALAYHSFNTLGGLIGQMAKSVGLTLRDTGLVYKVLDGDQKLVEIPLANDWPGVLATLHLSHDRWEQGFDTLEDMFSFVACSPLFKKKTFEDDSYRSVPAGERLSIKQSFAKWLDTTFPEVSKEGFLEQLRQARPEVQAQYELALKRASDKRIARSKFNGDLVTTWTGRKHMGLGNLLKAFAAAFESEDAQVAWLLSARSEDIQSKVLALHASV